MRSGASAPSLVDRRPLAWILVCALLFAACTSDSTAAAPRSAASEAGADDGGTSPAADPNDETAAPAAIDGTDALSTSVSPGHLVDATSELGIDTALLGIRGHAVAAADINNDGAVDLFVGTFADRPLETYEVRGADGPAPDRILLGGPDGFTIDTSFTPPFGRTAGATFADLDNDGDPDLIISRNVRDDPRANGPSEIYRNDNGQLTPVAILDDDRGGRAVGTLDHNGDGLLDIVLVEDRWSGGSSALFENMGDFRFEDVTTQAGLPTDIFGLGLGIGDLDGDGRDDLVFGGSNRIFMASPNGFTEAQTSPLPWDLKGDEDDPAHVLLLDANDDGHIDIAIGQHFNSTLDFGQPEPIRLFMNDGSEGPSISFDDATDRSGLAPLPTKSPQLVALDLDADGRTDIVTTASSGDTDALVPLVLLASGANDQPTYEASVGDISPHYWIDAVTLDANGDGRLDVFFVEWEPSIGSRLFLNMPIEP